ncbi:protein phosphatase 2C domain-containing protein [Acaryochloris sp. IP29b_bin.148]|uniref:protein phosphatase 2C domain-containing protein n=1 Tax=Acaryochloris sp. IP29b_bin.148 TaxID=2969218 RepID=UPI002603D34C|nr:protein phosphatase 2C domain-containing protein [Acaryochloris sp. IP29b_bin.148]
MQQHFEVAAGSILGQNHRRVSQNNQDAWASLALEQAMIAVVCDGCGSRPNSEVGAQFGAQLTVHTLAQLVAAERPEDELFWQMLKKRLLGGMQTLQKRLGADSQGLLDYWLFTLMGCLVTPETTWIFGLGDGVFAINEQIHPIGPFANNTPPYLAYSLLWDTEKGPDPFQIQIYAQHPTEQVQSVLIGSDGVGDLMDVAENCLPGRPEPVGPLNQFWRCDRYFQNPDQVRRRLAQINREVIRPDWHTRQVRKIPGLLPDDTTLISIRRKRTEGGGKDARCNCR